MAAFFLDETGRLRTAWRFVIFGIGFVLVQIGVSLLAGACWVGYLVAQGQSLDSILADPRLMGEWMMSMQIIASIPMASGCFGLVLLCRHYLDRRSLGSLGFVRPGRSLTESVAGGLLIGSVPILLVIVVLLAAGGLAWEGISASSQTALLVPALIAMAFTEEILCRGYLLQNLIDIRRPVFGMLFSSLVFWLLHAVNPSVWSSWIVPVNLFGAGVALSLAYRASGSIWFPTALHFAWNFTQGVLFQATISGLTTDGLFDVRVVESAPVWLTGGTFGIEGSLLTTAVEIALSLLFVLVLPKRGPATFAAKHPDDLVPDGGEPIPVQPGTPDSQYGSATVVTDP